MPNAILKNQLISWLRQQHYWLQYAGNRLLEEEVISEEMLNVTFDLFCEEYGLRIQSLEHAPVAFAEVETSEQTAAIELRLQAIKDIKNVNALQSGQSITIAPNLTIIYGGNGSGKSGYIRLLNNAFIARGDKHILQNVYNPEATGEPCCDFTFHSAEVGSYDLHYPEQKDRPEFAQYSVFDSYSARVQLESDNRLNFTPVGFQFFDNLIELYDGLKARLNADIRLNRPDNRFSQLFANDNNIRTAILNLGIDSSEDELKIMGTYSEKDSQRLVELNKQMGELGSLNISGRIREIQILSGQFTQFITQCQAILDSISHSKIDSYKSLIESYHGFKRLVSEEGIKQMEKFNIEKLGSNEWKDFIKAAKKYASMIDDGATTYPNEKDRCLFCLQPLRESEIALINSYWMLLVSQAENELAQVIQKIKEALLQLRALPILVFTDGMPTFDHISQRDQSLAQKWKVLCIEIEQAKKDAIENLSNCILEKSFKSCDTSILELQMIKNDLDQAVQNLINTNPDRQIQELQREQKFLLDKELLSKLINDVLDFVKSHKWARKAEGCLSAFRTNTITSMQGNLFSEHISERFISTFADECRLLNAPTVVQIVQRNVKMSTLRKLQVAGELANRILSEGEQRSVSLADFITEAQLNPHNKGVIFDDPVNSMDHERKELIAKRLVQLSATKQVITFTHDLSFLIRLRLEAENYPDLVLSLVSIRRAGNSAGIVLVDIPWVGQPVKARIGVLKNRLVVVRKIERCSTDNEYADAVKTWYMYLRESWERAVEERLFKGVVERFAFGIQTQKLQKVEVTPELLSDIETGMTESSKWVHDTAAGLNPPTPDSTKLKADLDFLEAFTNKCKAP